MICFDAQDLRSLSETYVVANTPAFLFSRFKLSTAVERLAKAESSADLAAAVLDADDFSKGLDSVVTAYAALTALTLQDAKPQLDSLRAVRFLRLEWAHWI